MVTAGGHPVPELIEVVLQTFLEALDRLPVDPRSTTVGFDQPVRFYNELLRYLVRFRFLQSVPPFRLTSRESSVTRPLRSAPITGVSSLLRVDPPLCRASILSPLRGASRLGFSLCIAATGSHVPHDSPVSSHAAFMPEAIRPVHRLPDGLALATVVRTFAFGLILLLPTPQQRFRFIRLPIPYLTSDFPEVFDWNVHNPDSLSEQLPVVWDLLL